VGYWRHFTEPHQFADETIFQVDNLKGFGLTAAQRLPALMIFSDAEAHYGKAPKRVD